MSASGRPIETMYGRAFRLLAILDEYTRESPATEDSLFDVESMRRFAEVDQDGILDEATICKFRHFLERHRLTSALFRRTEQYLSERGLLLSEDTIVDATIVQAPLRPRTGPA